MNIYNKNKKHWSQYRRWDVYTCACWRASMSSPSPSLSHCLVLSFGAIISQCCSVLS